MAEQENGGSVCFLVRPTETRDADIPVCDVLASVLEGKTAVVIRVQNHEKLD